MKLVKYEMRSALAEADPKVFKYVPEGVGSVSPPRKD